VRFLVVGGPLFVGFHFLFGAGFRLADPPFGAAQHDAIDQSDDPAVGGVDPRDGVQKHAAMLTIAARAEATLVGLLRGKPNVGGVHDRQNMAAGGALVGGLAGGDQHFPGADRRIGREVVELKRLIAAFRQPVNAKRAFALHRIQQHGPARRPPPAAYRQTRRAPLRASDAIRFQSRCWHGVREPDASQVVPGMYDNGRRRGGMVWF
jgi:hypothetical protein